MTTLPDRGRLGILPLPALLLLLVRAGYSGRLRLSSGNDVRTVEIHEGRPFRVAGPGLCDRLVASGRLSRDDAARVAARAGAHGGSEENAILALRLLAPRALWIALRAHERELLIDCFGWPDGEFELATGREVPADVRSLAHDPFDIIHSGVSLRWSVPRALACLGTAAERFASLDPGSDETCASLRCLAGVEALSKRLDGRMRLGDAVRACDTTGAAAAFLLHGLGALVLSDEPLPLSPTEASAPARPRIEIRVAGKGASPKASRESSLEEAANWSARRPADTVRRALCERHARLAELDHYEVLGVARSADAAAIRRAYFSAAKTFHPDAVARLGLDDVREEANALFARIGAAHAVLLDPAQRRDYDESLAGGGAEEAQRIASAETLYRKGEVLLRKGAFDDALRFLRPAAELDPEDAAYQSALGWALFKKQQPEPDAACAALERAVARDPSAAVTHQRLAALLRAVGKASEAAFHLARSRELDPRSTPLG